MKVLRDTDEMLVLEHRPVLFTSLFAGVALATLAWGVFDYGNDGLIKIIVSLCFMAAALLFAESGRLTLDAANNSADLKNRTVWGFTHQRFELTEVSNVEVETSRTDDGENHRLVLVIEDGQAKGRYPVTKTLYSWFDTEVGDRTNQWLNRQKGRSDPPALGE